MQGGYLFIDSPQPYHTHTEGSPQATEQTVWGENDYLGRGRSCRCQLLLQAFEKFLG